MTATTTNLTAGRTLVSDELFELLTTDVMREKGLHRDLAQRVVDQALAFLATSAHHPDAFLRPSTQVDTGWHCFLLRTAAYQEFCTRTAGWFIHHEPTDDPPPPTHTDTTPSPTRQQPSAKPGTSWTTPSGTIPPAAAKAAAAQDVPHRTDKTIHHGPTSLG